MKSIFIHKHNLMRATLMLALIVTCATAWAASGNWSSNKASSFSSANGTTINITSPAELALLAYNVTTLGEDYSGYTINLTKDLDMSAHYWDTPIGLYDETHDNTFLGTFDGGNHTISGINTNHSTSNYQGLFGFVGRSFSYDDPNVPSQSGTVRNLTLASSTITGKENVGGIAAYLWNGTISNCHVLSSVSIQAGSNNSKYHGGIVGQIKPDQISQTNSNYNSATVQNCTCGASITSGSYSGCSDYGGIVGSYNRNTSTLTGCFYNGTNISANSNKGAIIGSCTTTSGISNCYYYYPSSINGIGSGGSVNTVKQVYKLTLGTSDLTISSSPTYIFNGTNYYATGAVTTISNTQYITALTATSGSINNVTYSNDKRTAYFGFGSDATVTATFATGGLCGLNAWWDLSEDGTVLTISGSGAMYDYGYNSGTIWTTKAPWGTNITSVTVGDGITSIGNYAFIGCQNVASVTIGSSVQSIGIAAINHCDQMTTVTLPASVNTIAYAAFENCQALTTIYINNTGAVSLTGSNNNHFNAPNLEHIVFSTLNGALANTTGHWTHYAEECCVKLGNQFFHATNEGGTNAYQIATGQDLHNLETAVNSDQQNCYGLTFRQTADIDLGSTNFTWIYRDFNGTYDGGNYTISNLNISNSNMNVGLFTEVSGTVKNVRLINPEVETSWNFTTNVGSLIGYLRGRMENCYAVSPTVSSPNCSWARLGALVGHSYTGTISNCYYIKGTGNATKGIGFNENGTGDVLPVYTLTLGEGITTSTNPTLNYNGTNYYSGTIILPAAPAGYVYNYTVNGSAINGNTFTISEDATVARTTAPDPTHFSQSGNEYTIHTTTGWDVFCDMLENGETFSGKIVKLGANIEVSRMAGTYSATTNSGHAFSGAFNGYNNTLTFSCTAADNYVAPFAYLSGTSAARASISDLNVVTNITATNYRHIAGLIAVHMGYVDVTNCHAQVTLSATIGTENPNDLYPAGLVSQTDISGRLTISNCTTTGTIYTDGKYAAGMVGVVQGSATITNSVSSVTINSSRAGDGTHGGLVAVTQTNSTTTIEGCLFNGKLLSVGTTTTTIKCGGFVGWRSGSLTISNSLYAPNVVEGETWINDSESATFVRNPGTGTNAATITNCYYVTPLGTPQGKQQRSITAADENVTVALSGTPTVYTTSGITAYKNGNTQLPGLLYNNDNDEVLYAGNGDNVSLTLGNNPPEGYDFNGYTVSPAEATLTGTENPYTLTMPNANVTIGAEFEPQIVSVNYLDEDGVEQQCNSYTTLTGNEVELTAGWYVADGTINFTNSIVVNDNVHIILKDNAVMNVGTENSYLNGNGISANGHSISIYGQSTGADKGQLNLYANHGINTYNGSVTINGGQVTATGNEYGIRAFYGSVTINGGQVTATGNYIGISTISGSVTINGGQVTATGNNGIRADNITLGWTNPADYIYVNRYNADGTLTLTKTFTDGTNTYESGTVSASVINGKTLYPHIEGSVAYLDMNGQRQIRLSGQYTPLTNSMTTLGTADTETWYVVDGTIDFDHHISTVGDVHIILKDGAVMNVGTAQNPINGDGIQNYGIGDYNANSTISIYGQSTGTNNGQLFVYSHLSCIWAYNGDFNCSSARITVSSTNISIWAHKDASNKGNLTLKDATINATGFYALEADGGNLTINGGEVTATANLGIFANNGNMTINSSQVSAAGSSYYGAYAYYGDITINGGQVTATGNNYGIYAKNGNITLGWTNATDFIYANSYNATTVSIAEDKVFIDEDGNIFNSGTITKVDETYPIDGKTLYPYSENAVPYLDMNGQQRYCVAYTNLTGNEEELTAGWYVANGNVSFDHCINVTGDVHIILANGAVMNVGTEQSPISGDGISAAQSLSIYAQSTGESKGQLHVYATNLGIYTGSPDTGVGSVTINGGQVTAHGNNHHGIQAFNGSVTINGGQVTATGGQFGIFTNFITLGWTNTTDYIYASRFMGHVTIAEGKSFICNDGNTYTGDITPAQTYPFDGKTLYPNPQGTAFYLDMDGEEQLHFGCISLDGSETSIGTEGQETWYVADHDVSFTNTINVAGDVHLILKDGVVMNVGTEESPIDNSCILVAGHSLSIYGQSTGENNGRLNLYTTMSSGIYASGSNFNCSSARITVSSDHIGIHAYYDSSTVQINLKDATVIATGSEAIHAVGVPVTINGGQVTANGTESGIYASNSSVTISGGQVTATGNNNGINADHSSVIINGGQVTANGNNNGIFSNDGSVTINGGQVTVTGNGTYSAGIYIHNGTVTISGGHVTTTGGYYGINASGDVTISGGQVTVTGNNYGIYSQNGITLGWTNLTDYIYASNYYTPDGTVNIAENKIFVDEKGLPYSGTVYTWDIDGKTLYPKGVILKPITGYGDSEKAGWVFISSPVVESIAPSEVHNLLGENISTDPEHVLYNFDLYRLNPSNTMWENYHAHTENFNLANGKGYLYATKAGKTLVFAGEYNTNTSKDVRLQEGWNLVGNPFDAPATVDMNYFRMNEGGTAIEPIDITQNTDPIDVCTGIVVELEANPEATRLGSHTITFTRVTTQQSTSNNKGGLQIALTQTVTTRGGSSTATLDNAIVSFNEGSQLGKFYFGTQNANIYIPQDGKEYAIAYSDGVGEMPLNFNAKENGEYMLTFSTSLNSKFQILNLIDNLTGADVDLLQTPEYTFNAKVTDYESRFKLVFVSNTAFEGESDNESFAFYTNGSWIIANEGEATLQVIDLNGRILSSETVNGSVSKAIHAAAGVYVLRLINGNDVRTQKMVIN